MKIQDEADGHGPQAGCNFRRCGIPDDASNCPFTADVQLPEGDTLPLSVSNEPPRLIVKNHEHDWRQYWAWASDIGRMEPDGFYCTSCLLRHE